MKNNTIEYQLNFDKFGNKRKYKLSKKRRSKIIENSSWVINDLENQWIYKDYNSFYIVISKFGNDFKVSCSGASAGSYIDLDSAKVAAFEFCNKIIK